MRWLLALVVLTLGVISLVGGYKLAKKSEKAAYALGLPCLLVIFVRLGLRYFPAIEFSLLPFDFYTPIRPWWVIPFAFAILGVGVARMSTENARKAVGVFAGAVLLLCAQRLYYNASFDPATTTGTVHPKTKVCPQTTDFTCGAAAAATLLHYYGIEASERDMAERCWTNALTGTDEFCVAHGLRQRLEGSGRWPRIVSSDWEQLVARSEPAMATVRFSTLIDHWVVVFAASEEGVEIGDPLKGRYRVPKARFLVDWRRTLVTCDPLE